MSAPGRSLEIFAIAVLAVLVWVTLLLAGAPAVPSYTKQELVLAGANTLKSEVTPTATTAPEAVLPKTSTQPLAVVGIPEKLDIPAIGVDASIYAHNQGPDGLLSPEKGRVAWLPGYNRPGQAGDDDDDLETHFSGDSFLAGHVTRGDVFSDLVKLQPGDAVYVTDESGYVNRFVVEGQPRKILKTDFPWVSLMLEEPSNEPVLWIITCDANRPIGSSHSLENVYIKTVLQNG